MSAHTTIVLIFKLLNFILFVRILLSWIPHNTTHPVIDFIYRITDPILNPLRDMIPPIGGTIDISPIAAFIILSIIERILLSFL